jgi:hypothetical protein
MLLICWPEAAGAAGPELTVVAPQDGAVIEGADIPVTFTTSGITIVPTSVPVAEAGKHPELNRAGEGHLHFVIDLQPLVVWDRNAPYTLMNVPPGAHQLMVELVQNDHSSFSPPVMRQIQFRSTVAPAAMPRTGVEPHADAPLRLLALAVVLLILGLLLLGRPRWSGR